MLASSLHSGHNVYSYSQVVLLSVRLPPVAIVHNQSGHYHHWAC